MALFKLQEFIAKPSLEEINRCRKIDLISIAENYNIKICKPSKKDELREIIIVWLVEQELLTTSGASERPEEVTLGVWLQRVKERRLLWLRGGIQWRVMSGLISRLRSLDMTPIHLSVLLVQRKRHDLKCALLASKWRQRRRRKTEKPIWSYK